MASNDRLYPPNIAGTLPSFCAAYDGTATMVVPFSMNTTVSVAEVGGLRVRIKDTATDTTLLELLSNIWGESDGQLTVSFNLSALDVARLMVGHFYKVQLAFYRNIKNDREIIKQTGYYSTVGIIKYTVKPVIKIIGLEESVMNSITSQQFVATYENSDSTERVHQYRFTVHSLDGGIVEDSGWLLHNSYNDSDSHSSVDTYICKRELFSGWQYYVQYSVITTNGLEATSVRYQVEKVEDSGTALLLNLATELDYDNGRIKVFIPNPENYPSKNYIMGLENGVLQGTFLLTRSSSETNYQQWDILSNFPYQDHYSSFVYWDYSVAAGVEYKYAIQKYNSSGIFSPKVISEKIKAYFEDIFLFDGQRQLKIRFNPKITSFKEVVSETKKTTLGSQFPFIMRNGAVKYKEFPINGLISYLSDNDRLFMTTDELSMTKEFLGQTDITDENMHYEQVFKLQVLNWLNNGSIKVFRSPQEGNYIVRLMNVSLTPNDTVSRMLHSFTCTATQVSEFTIERLEEFALTSPEINKTLYNTHEEEIILSAVISNLFYSYPNDGQAVLAALREMDLTAGKEILSIKIDKCSYGSIFQWGSDYDFVIGIDGSYEITRDVPAFAELKILNPVLAQTGIITLTVVGDSNEKFESTYQQQNMGYLGYTVYGPDLIDITEPLKDGKDVITPNIFDDFNLSQLDIENMYIIKYKTLPYIKNTSPTETLESFARKQLGNSAIYAPNRMIVFDYEDNPYLITEVESAVVDGIKQVVKVILKPIADYRKRFNVYFGDEDPIDISQLSSGALQIDITKDKPLKKDGSYYFAIGGCVLAELYFQGSFTTFSQEYEDKALGDAAQEVDIAYREYLAAIFNLRESKSSDNILMIYNNRRFYYITRDQAEGFYVGTKKFSPLQKQEGFYSEAEINSRKTDLELAQLVFEEQLERVLKEEKEGK